MFYPQSPVCLDILSVPYYDQALSWPCHSWKRCAWAWTLTTPWIEYAHNSLVSFPTGMLLFVAANDFQPPSFPEQEADVAVLSIQDNLRRCRQVWQATRFARLCLAAQNQRLADSHSTTAPTYNPGQKVWL